MKVSLKSVTPAGKVCPLPTAEQSQRELALLRERALAEKKVGREVVVVIGLGFVGTVMAAVVADATDTAGKPTEIRDRPSASQP